MNNIVYLWHPRSRNPLRRHWVSYSERIIIGGANLEQAGVLTVLPSGHEELRARLRVMGREFEEIVTPGHDITVWINGLELIIGVKAIADERMLVEFGIPPGSKVDVSLDAGAALDTPLMA